MYISVISTECWQQAAVGNPIAKGSERCVSNIHTVGRFSGEDLEFYKCRYSGSADGNWAVPKKRARPYDLVAALIPARELRLRVSQFEAYFSREDL